MIDKKNYKRLALLFFSVFFVIFALKFHLDLGWNGISAKAVLKAVGLAGVVAAAVFIEPALKMRREKRNSNEGDGGFPPHPEEPPQAASRRAGSQARN